MEATYCQNNYGFDIVIIKNYFIYKILQILNLSEVTKNYYNF